MRVDPKVLLDDLTGLVVDDHEHRRASEARVVARGPRDEIALVVGGSTPVDGHLGVRPDHCGTLVGVSVAEPVVAGRTDRDVQAKTAGVVELEVAPRERDLRCLVVCDVPLTRTVFPPLAEIALVVVDLDGQRELAVVREVGRDDDVAVVVGAVLIDLAVAVVVDIVSTDLGRTRVNLVVGVVAVVDGLFDVVGIGREAVAVAVSGNVVVLEALVDLAVAVVVHAVIDLGGTGVHVGIVVVAVDHTTNTIKTVVAVVVSVAVVDVGVAGTVVVTRIAAGVAALGGQVGLCHTAASGQGEEKREQNGAQRPVACADHDDFLRW